MFPGVWGLSGDFCIIDVFEGVPDGFLAVPGGFIICCHGYPCIPVSQDFGYITDATLSVIVTVANVFLSL